MSVLPPVARNIYVYCKKCETERYFKVLTHTSATSAKLRCEVCKCSRVYHVDEDSKGVAPGRKAGSVKNPRSSSSSAWMTVKEKYSGPDAINYTVNTTFNGNESINHPTFGLGFVTKALPNKIEVLFSDGVKELLHSRK